jgi:hypothetical protein
VHFGGLGALPVDQTVVPLSSGVSSRTYDNGYVNVDAPRANELDGNGIQHSAQGGRYQPTSTDSSGATSITGDYLSYATGLTRVWSYDTPQQASQQPGFIAMSNYSSTSEGGFADKKQGLNGGVELQYSRVYGKLSKRTDWSLTAGLSLNGITAKTSGIVTSTLNSSTDFYSLNGQTAPTTSSTTPYVGPTYVNVVDANGNVLLPSGYETTVPISVSPSGPSVPGSVAGGATVTGAWELTGAYYMVKLGPSMHTQLTDNLSLTAGLGLAGAFAGTTYSSVESFTVPNTTKLVQANQISDITKFLGGYYADFNVDWSANERTDIFGGLTLQKLGTYNQAVGAETARVDFGTSFGVRGGLSVKF